MPAAGQAAHREHVFTVPLQVHVQAVARAGNTYQDFAGKHLRRQVGGVTGLPGLFCALELPHPCQRPQLFSLTGVGIGNRHVPDHLARVPVQGDQPGVDGDGEYLVRAQRRPAVGGTATVFPVLRQFMVVTPKLLPSVRVQGDDIVVRRGQVHDPILYNG